MGSAFILVVHVAVSVRVAGVNNDNGCRLLDLRRGAARGACADAAATALHHAGAPDASVNCGLTGLAAAATALGLARALALAGRVDGNGHKISHS